jgi:hypothetical protein
VGIAGKHPPPRSRQNRLSLRAISGELTSKIERAGLATCRESSNVCVIGPDRIPAQRRSTHRL